LQQLFSKSPVNKKAVESIFLLMPADCIFGHALVRQYVHGIVLQKAVGVS
jgi:hypothetical protein